MQRQVDGLTVAAPFDGMVANVAVQDRDAVAPSRPSLTVVNLSAFEVEFDVPENYASEVTPGTRAEILYEGRTYPGKVTAVSPEIRDSQVRGHGGVRRRAAARPAAEPAGHDAHGARGAQMNVLKVPRGPFLEAGGGRRAYVVDGGVATVREIEVGRDERLRGRDRPRPGARGADRAVGHLDLRRREDRPGDN